MFENVEPLNKEKHKELRIKPLENLEFARNISQVPLSFTEFAQAARYYPIVISIGEEPSARAVLSLQPNSNSFLDTEGRWTVPYIPAHIRRYPFVLGRINNPDGGDDASREFTVCIDTDAGCFSTSEGEPLFQDDGEPGTITARALEFLKKFQIEMELTTRYLKQLQDAGCLASKQLTLNVGGNAQNLGAFQTADLSKLKELDDGQAAEMVKSGLVGLMYALNFSMANLDRFASRIQNARVAPESATVH